MEESACTLCGASSGSRLFTTIDYLTGDRFEVVRCARCALAFVSPRPTARELPRYLLHRAGLVRASFLSR